MLLLEDQSHLTHHSDSEREGCGLATEMQPLTFIVSTQQDPPIKGSNIQAINAHCASFAHKRRHRKEQESLLATQQAARRTLTTKVSSPVEYTTLYTDARKKRQPTEVKDVLSRPCISRTANHADDEPPQLLACSACTQQDPIPTVCAHKHNFDAQLFSILDPFSTVPLKLSRKEQTMLQDCKFSIICMRLKLSNLYPRSDQRQNACIWYGYGTTANMLHSRAFTYQSAMG